MNNYAIDENRLEELKRICWRYKDMKQQSYDLMTVSLDLLFSKRQGRGSGVFSDPVAAAASRREHFADRIRAIELCSKIAGEDSADALLYGVITRGSSYNSLRMNGKIYCGRDQYYNMRSKFFWLLDKYL